jgi:monoamine oxidase
MVDVIIIGAGAAGLAAARVIGKTGRTVTVLEARTRAGGRIYTLHDNDFSFPVEAGAEFIHGNLPHTTSLLKEAEISFYETTGNTWNVNNGEVSEGDLFPKEWNELLEKLNTLKHDMSIAQFLDNYFHDAKYTDLRNSIVRFVQGYDAADTNKASALALRDEWSGEDSLTGYRPHGGYSILIDFLVNECLQQGSLFHFNSVVREVYQHNDHVEVKTESGDRFTAKKLLITIPPAVIKAGGIAFTPDIGNHMAAIQKIETGCVIKFLVEFKSAFWEQAKDSASYRSMPGLQFVFSDAFIPTWWTQQPVPDPLLTGWLAGPTASENTKDETALRNEAVQALAYIFGCNTEVIEQQINAMKVINWGADPFSRGAYAYKTVDTNSALAVLSQPVNHTIYFAGEAFYNGSEMGTVEAALASGTITAQKMLT